MGAHIIEENCTSCGGGGDNDPSGARGFDPRCQDCGGLGKRRLFQSDKYPTCPPGKVPLSVTDPTAQDLLWEYAQRRRSVDAEFSSDLEEVLRQAGYKQPTCLSCQSVFTPHHYGDTICARCAFKQ